MRRPGDGIPTFDQRRAYLSTVCRYVCGEPDCGYDKTAEWRDHQHHYLAHHPTSLATLQFTFGGLFDGEPAWDLIHLIRESPAGHGKVLCKADRFAEPLRAGWSIGGGIMLNDDPSKPCPDCLRIADELYPDLPIWRNADWAKLFGREVSHD